MTQRVALGFKLHTGWAVLVAVARHPGEIQVLLRCRIELLPPDGAISRFIYHAAAELPLSRAQALVKRAEKEACKAALVAFKSVLQDLDSPGVKVDVCGILSASTSVPDDLSAILRSHPLIHTAEGALFREAIVAAGEKCGLKVVVAREREVWTLAADAWGATKTALRRNVDDLRKTLGPPWSADHKSATAIALLALKSKAA